MLSQNLTEEQTALFFEGINFTEFVPIEAESEDGENKMLLINKNNPEIQIDEALYTKMIEYLRVILGIHPKVEKTKSKATKEAIIYEEQMAVKNEQRKHKNDKWDTSLLFPLISACLNHPGFKYKKNELREVGIFEFMDCVKRLQIYENTTSFMTGMYMGMMDTKKLDLNKELNWARDIYSD